MAHAFSWCDIPVQDLQRAMRFYSAVLGVNVVRQDYPDFAIGVLPHNKGEVGACLYVSREHLPSAHGPLLYLNCSGRLDAAVAAVAVNGGRVLQAVHSLAEYGRRAVVLDSEGNRLALHST